jgi:hypothetical protein
LFPEIVTPLLDNVDGLPACSAVEALERQEPFINQTLAYHALAMLARLFRHGDLSYHGGFINLAKGRMASLPVVQSAKAIPILMASRAAKGVRQSQKQPCNSHDFSAFPRTRSLLRHCTVARRLGNKPPRPGTLHPKLAD